MGKRSIKTYKTEALRFGFFIVLGSVLLFACEQEELTAKQIMQQTVDTYGGLKSWNTIDLLSFDKKVVLYQEDGSIERQTQQFQLFQFQEPFGKIEWQEHNIDHQIIYENGRISSLENDSLLQAPQDINRAKRAFFASEFVIKQPFDLLRDDVILTRKKDTLINNKTCYVISVAYKNEATDADRWYYVIDKESALIIANKVVLKDHTSWVENLTYDTSTDFIFNAERKSYRLNDAGEKMYLRARYFYSNYLINK